MHTQVTEQSATTASTEQRAQAAVEATELARRVSPFVAQLVLADFAASYPAEAREMIERCEQVQAVTVRVRAEMEIPRPQAMTPAYAQPQAPDAVTAAREALEMARARLLAAVAGDGAQDVEALWEAVSDAEDSYYATCCADGL